MLDRNLMSEILGHALSKGGGFAEIFVEHTRLSAISCENNRIETIRSGLDSGAGIRVIQGQSAAYAMTNDLSPAGLRKAADIAARAVGTGAGDEIELAPHSRKAGWNPTIEIPPQQVDVRDKVEEARKANDRARSGAGAVSQVNVRYSDRVCSIQIANSEGVYVEDERSHTIFTVRVVASENGVTQTGYEVEGGFIGFELFDTIDVGEMAFRARDRALLMLGARPAPAGKMPVVISGQAGGTMIHEACGHGLEADLVQKGVSAYSGEKGNRVASELVTVIDDASLPGRSGSYGFDDEAVVGQRTFLIERGVLKNYLYDRMTASREDVAMTGNGRRESYRHRPIPRMSNTFIRPGEVDPQSIVGATERGLFVRRMGGGQVDTATGDFVFEVSEGYLIRGGKIGDPVRGATLTGNGPEVLRIVDMIGNDLSFSVANCVKDGQEVPVSTGQPTLRIPSMVIGGTKPESDGLSDD